MFVEHQIAYRKLSTVSGDILSVLLVLVGAMLITIAFTVDNVLVKAGVAAYVLLP